MTMRNDGVDFFLNLCYNNVGEERRKEMRRQDKYPNTEVFHYLNLNPHNRITTDCVVRAIAGAVAHSADSFKNEKVCKALWGVVMNSLTDWACDSGYMPTDTKCYSGYLVNHGFIKHGQLRHDDNTKYTLKEFIDTHRTGTYLVNMPCHLTLVIDGVNYDNWDCTKSSSKIGVFWEKCECF